MAISKITLPDNTTQAIKDSRIPGVDTSPASGSSNVITSGGVHAALTELNTTLFGEEVTKTKDDATVYRVTNGVVSSTGIRLRVVLQIGSGYSISASCSMGQGVAVSIYDTEEKCLDASTDYLQTLSYSYVSSITGTALYGGYLCVSLAKTNNSSFSDSDIQSFIGALNLTASISSGGVIGEIQDSIHGIYSGTSEPSSSLGNDGDIYIQTS